MQKNGSSFQMKAAFQRQNTIIIHFTEREKKQKHLVNLEIDSEHKRKKPTHKRAMIITSENVERVY